MRGKKKKKNNDSGDDDDDNGGPIDLVFFDTAASALKVDSMIKAVNNCYSFEYANIHRGIYDLSAKLSKKGAKLTNKV